LARCLAVCALSGSPRTLLISACLPVCASRPWPPYNSHACPPATVDRISRSLNASPIEAGPAGTLHPSATSEAADLPGGAALITQGPLPPLPRPLTRTQYAPSTGTLGRAIATVYRIRAPDPTLPPSLPSGFGPVSACPRSAGNACGDGYSILYMLLLLPRSDDLSSPPLFCYLSALRGRNLSSSGSFLPPSSTHFTVCPGGTPRPFC